MIYRNMFDSGQREQPHDDVGSPHVAESPKTTIRWDEGLKSDAERCAKARGIPVAEFIRQAIAHYVAWTSARESPKNDESPQR